MKKQRILGLVILTTVLFAPIVLSPLNVSAIEFLELKQIVQVTHTSQREEAPHITRTNNGMLYMVYHREGVAFITHSEDGIHWAGSRPIESAPGPALVSIDICHTSTGTLWAVLSRFVGGGQYEDIYITNSTDGYNWSEPWPLVTTSTYDTWARITTGPDDSFWVLYSHSVTPSTGGDWDLYVLHSDDGNEWSSPQQITDESFEERWGDICVGDDGSLHVTYQKYTGGNFWLYETHSSDGLVWSEGVEIVSNTYYPVHGGSLTYTIKDGYLAVFGTAQQYDGNIYLLNSSNGIDWSTPQLLVETLSVKETPDIIVTFNQLFTSYKSSPSGNWEEFIAIFNTEPPRLDLELSGEFDFKLRENIYLQLAGLLVNPDTNEPVSGATIECWVYDPNGDLLQQFNLIEDSETPGVYVFTAPLTMRQLNLARGMYLIYAKATITYQDKVVAEAIDMLQFHIDPPGDIETPITFTLLSYVGLVFLSSGTFITGWILRGRRKKSN